LGALWVAGALVACRGEDRRNQNEILPVSAMLSITPEKELLDKI
jgi:hypothetical protein